MREIIIYGNGDYGKRLYFLLKECGVSVACFCKTSASENERCEGLPVIGSGDLEEYKREEVLIFVALKDKRSVSDVKKLLLEKGFLPPQILDMRSFFEDNVIPGHGILRQEGSKYCLVCGSSVNDFEPAGEKSALFAKYNIIGGGCREHAVCPVCGSLDRERWQKYVIENETEILNKPCRVLHIAQEESNYRLIQRNPACDYYSGDIEAGRAMHRVDLTDLQFCDNFFDYIIANHVFEHVLDERRMFQEIKRVLKPDGKLICSFPICMDMETFEDARITSGEDREAYYGQKDHVRLYGRDYREHVEGYGLLVEVKRPEDFLCEAEWKRYGLIKNDVILVCSRKQD